MTEPLYKATEDEQAQQWVYNKLQKKNGGTFQVSCAKCFTALSYEATKGRDGKYLAKGVTEFCQVSEDKVYQVKEFYGLPIFEQEEFSMYIFEVKCKYCREKCGTYDIEKKEYGFEGVIPNFIGK